MRRKKLLEKIQALWENWRRLERGEMNLEKRIFLYETKPRLPSENLAINRYCVDLVNKRKLDLIARVYSHTDGVILGYDESVADVNVDFCEKNGYEIVRRPSGGSAVNVSPDLSICYSFIFDPNIFGMERKISDIYKKITIPLAKKLGRDITVEGTYYLRVKRNGKSVPFGGHAIKFYFGKIAQFDGVINRTSLDINALSRILNLRKLYSLNGENYVTANGSVYDIKGNKIDIDLSKAELLRSEEDELKLIPGIIDLGMTDETFIKTAYNTLSEIFGKIEFVDTFSYDRKLVDKYRMEVISKSNGGNKSGLGHCFIDFVEPEPKIHYG